MICAIAGGSKDYTDKDPHRARLYTAVGFGTVWICLSIIRAVHAPPGSQLPEVFSRGPRIAASAADTMQVAFGAALMVLPYVYDESRVSNIQLIGIAAVVSVINVCANVAVRLYARRAQKRANLAEELAAKAAQRPTHRYHEGSPVMDSVSVHMESDQLLPRTRGRRASTLNA